MHSSFKEYFLYYLQCRGTLYDSAFKYLSSVPLAKCLSLSHPSQGI